MLSLTTPIQTIGLMSGSSLDGLDIVLTEFEKQNQKWAYKIHIGETIPYAPYWKKRLSQLRDSSAKDLAQTHIDYGKYLGEAVSNFIKKHQLDRSKIQLIGSHGHTIFHFPEKAWSTQIGEGSALAFYAGIPVVCDFRMADLARGGQGAPIVPIGDQLLFGEYKACLNLGGFANISCQTSDSIKAFDVTVCNMLLNQLAREAGKEYDEKGAMAKKGKVIPVLLEELSSLKFLHQAYPKSLSRHWVLKEVQPIWEKFKSHPIEDRLSTQVMHIVKSIKDALDLIAQNENFSFQKEDQILIGGGGAHNDFLVEQMKSQLDLKVFKPETLLIDYKEALIMAFMAILFIDVEPNIYSSVTAASSNSIAGAFYQA